MEERNKEREKAWKKERRKRESKSGGVKEEQKERERVVERKKKRPKEREVIRCIVSKKNRAIIKTYKTNRRFDLPVDVSLISIFFLFLY